MTTTSRLRSDTASGLPPSPAPSPPPPWVATAADRKPGPAGPQGTPIPAAGPGTPPDVREVDAARGEVCTPTPRTWTIELPAGLKVLSLNQRLHWAEKNRRGAELKKAAWAVALSRRVPHLDRVSVIVEYQPPDKRHRDADNIPAASGKYMIDGIVAAGVLDDDEAPLYVADIRYRLGEQHPKGRLVLHITEEVPQ